MVKHTILCVDDEIDNVDALERLFRKKYTVLRSTSGKEALKILDQHQGPVSLIISDQRMPEMTGVEFLEKSIASRPETVRILLTGYTDIDSVIGAVNQGQIFRYLTKPWDPIDLVNTVDRAIEHFQLGVELKTKNQELAQALGELKNLDKAKSNFMILINHELKTPLTSIINFTSLLSETKLDEEQSLFVNRVQQSANKLRFLIDDVLLIVRAETKQLNADLQTNTLIDLNRYLTSETTIEINKKNQIIQQNMIHQNVLCDIRLIGQVFNRIIHNAAKFGTEGSPIIANSSLEGQFVKFSIHNQGSRISEKVIDKIFKPFFIDEDIMNHSTGMGLGLTICQSILQIHNSKIDITNESDGVTVSFLLPAK